MAEIVFVASHPNAIKHFEDFQVTLRGRGIESKLVTVEDLSEVEKACAQARKVFVGIGSPFCLEVIRALRDKVVVYYDNPKRDVPGRYGEIAREAIAEGAPVLYVTDLGYVRLKSKEILYLGSAADNRAGFKPFCDVIRATTFERPTTLSYRRHPRGDLNDFAKLREIQKKNLWIIEDNAPDAVASIRYADHICFFQTTLEADARLMHRDCMVITDAEQAFKFSAWISDQAILEELGYKNNWPELLYQQVAPVKA